MGSCGVVEWSAGSIYDTYEGSWVVGSFILALNDNFDSLVQRLERLTQG